MKKLNFFLVCFSMVAGLSACADDIDEAEELIDCGKICTRYDECVSEIDVSDCTAQCENDLDNITGYEAEAEVCESCIDDGACADIEACWADCPIF